MKLLRTVAWFVLVLLPLLGRAQSAYQAPPPQVLDVLNAPVTPGVSISPTGDRLLLLDSARHPSIKELAEPTLALAGGRINPRNRGPQRMPRTTGVTIQTIPAGVKTVVALPPDARLSSPLWAPDGTRFAFALHLPTTIELWVADARTGAARRLDGLVLNAPFDGPFHWMPDGRTLLCRTVPARQGPPPAPPTAPTGPNVQESSGKPAPVRTYQDLLKSAHDDALFEYYATSQLKMVDAQTGEARDLGRPDLYDSVDPAPGGGFLLVTTIQKPFSRLLNMWGFPTAVEVWDLSATTVHVVARRPSMEGIPIQGVPTGPRSIRWRPTAPATLVWAEALDGGDPRTKTTHRDRLLTLAAPFRGEPVELVRLEHRFQESMTWGERDGLMLVGDYDRDRRWTRTFLIQADTPGAAPRLVWERSARDRYRHPGTPLMRTLPNGEKVLWQKGRNIYLAGSGASAAGDHPFLDRFNLDTFKAERLFQCGDDCVESVVSLVAADDASGERFITEHETLSTPPNYLLRSVRAGGGGGGETVALTRFPDPTPQLRRIRKRLITYKRADGVPLSFTLYLPPDYQPGQRLPTVVWAYPLEFNDADTAGQVAGSTNHFTTFGGASHLFFLLSGYAVLDGATMPIVGSPETMNDTFIQQIVDSARAAIAKAAELGVTDPDRVGVAGHSYGAFMTANLLAHSDLFRAGIARSGAYNRTLTPFGFQGERRTYWEAPETYARLSPFMHANKINEPLLLIHGEKDDNPGTFPIQSERLYQAIQGNGGIVRLVLLPFEAHGYGARESIEHTLHESLAWFDRHVKNAPSRPVNVKSGAGQ